MSPTTWHQELDNDIVTAPVIRQVLEVCRRNCRGVYDQRQVRFWSPGNNDRVGVIGHWDCSVCRLDVLSLFIQILRHSLSMIPFVSRANVFSLFLVKLT